MSVTLTPIPSPSLLGMLLRFPLRFTVLSLHDENSLYSHLTGGKEENRVIKRTLCTKIHCLGQEAASKMSFGLIHTHTVYHLAQGLSHYVQGDDLWLIPNLPPRIREEAPPPTTALDRTLFPPPARQTLPMALGRAGVRMDNEEEGCVRERPQSDLCGIGCEGKREEEDL